MANRIAEHDHDAARGQRSESCLAAGERAGDFPPLAQDVEQRARQPRQREAVVPLLPFRTCEADRDGGKYQRDAEPSEKTENSFQHMPTIHATARCRPTWPSGRVQR